MGLGRLLGGSWDAFGSILGGPGGAFGRVLAGFWEGVGAFWGKTAFLKVPTFFWLFFGVFGCFFGDFINFPTIF